MAADPDGSSMAEVGPGPAREARRAAPAIRELWRGPGWRVFDASADQGRQVRDWITRVVSRHGCPARASDAALVVSELFTNAVMHGPAGGRVLVGYCLWQDGAQIVVCDAGGTTSPRLRDPGKLDEGGRGLQVVDAVAAAWGAFRAGHAQAVWCDLGNRSILPVRRTHGCAPSSLQHPLPPRPPAWTRRGAPPGQAQERRRLHAHRPQHPCRLRAADWFLRPVSRSGSTLSGIPSGTVRHRQRSVCMDSRDVPLHTGSRSGVRSRRAGLTGVPACGAASEKG
jgi:anti-sigma regulatory factor (Ser/Thr protein kinase)